MAWPAIGSGKSFTPCGRMQCASATPAARVGVSEDLLGWLEEPHAARNVQAREWTARQDAIATCSSHVAPKSCGRAVTAV